MPLDRPITVGIRSGDDYDDSGRFQPGAVTSYAAWATAIDISVQRNLGTGGARLEADRVFRIRWFEEAALAPVTSISVTDELGLTYTVTHVEEFVGRYGDHRRRWLDLEGTKEAQT